MPRGSKDGPEVQARRNVEGASSCSVRPRLSLPLVDFCVIDAEVTTGNEQQIQDTSAGPCSSPPGQHPSLRVPATHVLQHHLQDAVYQLDVGKCSWTSCDGTEIAVARWDGLSPSSLLPYHLSAASQGFQEGELSWRPAQKSSPSATSLPSPM